ncbi:MAG: excalibur calcium-binding domain-containing protein [Alphaproteobacteria bacterium]
MRPRHLRSRIQERAYYARQRDKRALILTGAAGLALGATLFIGALFASMPHARAARVVGADNRIIGIPKNCDEARAARIAPMPRGSGFYSERLDIDRNGLACEPGTWDIFAKF